LPILVTPLGIVILVKLDALTNAESPILVTPLGMSAVPVHVEPLETTLSVIVNEPVVHATVDVVACALPTCADPTSTNPTVRINATRRNTRPGKEPQPDTTFS
jgi:hypothetical protein